MLFEGPNGELEPMPTTEHLNWGSTGMTSMSVQTITSFGDTEEHKSSGASDDLIHVYIHELNQNEDVTAIVSSDGFSDCIYKHKIGSIVCDIVNEKNASGDDIATTLMEEARRIATVSKYWWGTEELDSSTGTMRINDNYARHDDMSIAVLRTNRKN